MFATALLTLVLSQAPESKQVYDLKGDRLGMSLAEFKQKYRRPAPDGAFRRAELPYCSSDEPGKANDALFTQTWHHAAGIVNCSTTLGLEVRAGKGPTVADFPVHSLVHHFVDGKLYKITIVLPRAGFGKVTEGLMAKYGKPTSVQGETRQNIFGAKFTGAVLEWKNGLSTILAGEFGEDQKDIISGRVSQTSTIFFLHDELNKFAESRKPKTTAKDL